MSRITGALKATYNFFAGDAIILGTVAGAFILASLLVHAVDASNIVVAVVFVGIIVAGLATTLGREAAGHKRRQAH
jgi:hypothetical protein